MATFDASQKRTIWNKYHGSLSSAYDAFGRLMTADNFEADHIYPDSRGGRTIIENAQPLAPLSNQEKSDDLSGRINGRTFQVVYTGNGIGYMTVNGTKVTR